MDIKTVSMPRPTPIQSTKRSPEVQSVSGGVRDRVKEQEAQHTARAFGANEVINAQGHITGRHVNVTA